MQGGDAAKFLGRERQTWSIAESCMNEQERKQDHLRKKTESTDMI